MGVVLMSRVSVADVAAVGAKLTVNEKEAPPARLFGNGGVPETENGLLAPWIAMFDTTAGSVPVFLTVMGMDAVLVTWTGLNTTAMTPFVPMVWVTPSAT
jgi:hypothetical protein